MFFVSGTSINFELLVMGFDAKIINLTLFNAFASSVINGKVFHSILITLKVHEAKMSQKVPSMENRMPLGFKSLTLTCG